MLHRSDGYMEGYESVEELTEATVNNLHTAIMNISKIFGNTYTSTRIHFSQLVSQG